MLLFLDYLLTAIHSLFILFVLIGWAFKSTRKAHFIALGLTLLSWLALGFWYGLGYCPLTDWHWQLKKELGEQNLPSSFTKYVVDSMIPGAVNEPLVDTLTAAGLVFGIAMAVLKAWQHRTK